MEWSTNKIMKLNDGVIKLWKDGMVEWWNGKIMQWSGNKWIYICIYGKN
jgi:hypothetical protein